MLWDRKCRSIAALSIAGVTGKDTCTRAGLMDSM